MWIDRHIAVRAFETHPNIRRAIVREMLRTGQRSYLCRDSTCDFKSPTRQEMLSHMEEAAHT